MGLITLLLRNPVMFFVLVIPLLYSVVLHEIAHGWVASFFGDDTARRSGRLSLNPLTHLDPIGTVALFLVGFGWARPVPVNYARLKNFRPALVCVSLAGCVTNLLIAVISLFLLRLLNPGINSFAGVILIVVARINIILGVFNLIPIPPLDGSKIMFAFLPVEMQKTFVRIEPYGFFILIILILTGALNPLIMFMQKIIIGLVGGSL